MSAEGSLCEPFCAPFAAARPPDLPEADREQGPSSHARLRVAADSPDDVLAIAACAGHPRAPALIARRYGPRVRSKLHRWIGAQDLDDHVQEVFLRLHEHLPRMRDPASLRAFLIGITLRIACTELRRRRRSRLRLTTTGELPEPTVSFEDRGPAREALWRFESILRQLAPSSRRVFLLRYVEKLELAEVAAAMHISLATAKRHLARAAATVAAMARREPALADYLAQRSIAAGTVFCCAASLAPT